VIEQLEQLIGDISEINSKLVLLVGRRPSGKTKLLREVGTRLNIEPLNVGLELGRKLAAMPINKRSFAAGELLRQLADRHALGDLLLLDNLELLFDRSLQLDPLDLLKRHAHSRRVVAVWPGELSGNTKTGRLTYADMGHPEHQDYSLAGLVPFEIQ
jgi:hypothetical protein